MKALEPRGDRLPGRPVGPLVSLLALLLPALPVDAGVTKLERVSVSSSGLQANAGIERTVFRDTVAVSGDGRFVAFVATGNNLVPDDRNHGFDSTSDVFLRDRLARTTERISGFPTDGQRGNSSYHPAITPDGRFVAFVSDAEGPDTVYVWDRAVGRRELIREGQNPSISADGRFVVFSAFVTYGTFPNQEHVTEVHLHDRASGVTQVISRPPGGGRANGSSSLPAISADGRFVAFVSVADNLVPGDTPGRVDAFVVERATGAMELVSRSTAGEAANGALNLYHAPAISADGHFVAFSSTATNLVPGDGNSAEDLFLRDRLAGTTERVSVAWNGAEADGASEYPSMSGDGRYVSFLSDAGNLLPGQLRRPPFSTLERTELYVRDRLHGRTERMSLTGSGGVADGSPEDHAISADGRRVAFSTFAGNMLPADTNETKDVFVVERADAPSVYRIAVYRPRTGQWLLRALDGSGMAVPFGGPDDRPLPADLLFAQGEAQLALFRPATAAWFVRIDAASAVGPVAFGRPGDVPVPADFLGLRHAQMAVFRPGTREWLIRHDTGATVGPVPFGGPGDLPVPADYLGIGRSILAVFRPATGEWFLRSDAGETIGPTRLGGPGDVPLPRDYGGEGRAHPGVFRPSTGEWFLRDAEGGTTRIAFGQPGDVPFPDDYFGEGYAQLAVYRPATGEWLIRGADGSTTRVTWGGPGDRPAPARYPPGLTRP